MPSNPPMVLPSNEAEIESAPNNIGAYPPAMEPISPIDMFSANVESAMYSENQT